MLDSSTPIDGHDLHRNSSAARRVRRDRRHEAVVTSALRVAAWLSILVTVGIVVILVGESLSFFVEVSPVEFFFTSDWAPLFEPKRFGVIPIVFGTLMVAALAVVVSVPAGLLIAIYLSEYASQRLRGFIKPILEILAGIPSVVFGYFALTAVTPFLRQLIPATEVFNALSAGIVVGIMTLPMVASMSDDALSAVPRSLREGGFALGATKFEVIRSILVPAAGSGIIASFILSFSRAVGETMAVTLAAGATPQLTLNPLTSIQTMTAYIVQVSLGDTPHGSVEYKSIFVVGLLLFGITFTTNIAAQLVLKRLKKDFS